MASEVAAADRGEEAPKTKVFLSYSRKNMAFADRLEAALNERAFEPLIDRTEIYAFEDWWKRIQALIAQADTVIFVLSPDAVASEVCAKEVAFAASLNKRFAPVVFRRVDDKLVPDALARLNFIFFDDEAQFADSLKRLCDALATDIDWIRKHTEYGEAARHWSAAGRPGGLLLRSPVLEQAERWIASRPRNAPAPTEETQTFVTESRRGATRRRNILTESLAAGLLIALVLAGLAYWQRGVAIEQRQYAERALDAAIRTSTSLSLDLATRLRNRAGIQSALVKYLLDQAQRLQEQLTSYGRITPDLQRGEARALLESSLTLHTIGDNSGALAAADRARQIIESLLAINPDDPDWQQNLAVSYERAGDALAAQGKAEEALAAYRKALAIVQSVVARDSGNASAQQLLAINYVKIGDVLLDEEQKREEALAAYQMSLAIRQKLVDRDQGNVKWQRGLAISYERVGEVLLAQGKRDEALAAFQKRLAIAQELAAGDSDNTDLLRDLSVAYNKVGDVLLDAGKYEEALSAYQKGLAIRQKLAVSDPENTVWLRDVAISNNFIGKALSSEGKLDEALAAFQRGLAIEQKLVAQHQSNIVWQSDVYASDITIGNSLARQGKFDAALKEFRDGVAIAVAQTKAHPDNAAWQNYLRYGICQIGCALSHSFLLAREFAPGLEAAEQAVSLAPDMIWPYANRAHALMFLNRTDEARALYLQYRGQKNVRDRTSWETVIVEDFTQFRKAGLARPLMDEIEKQFADGG